MNNLNNSPDLKSLVIDALQEILMEDPNFFTNHLSILTWKSKKIEGALITKVGNRRYFGILRKDSQGQEYWKYKLLTKYSEAEQTDLETVIKPNSLTKEEPTKDYANNRSTEPSVNP